MDKLHEESRRQFEEYFSPREAVMKSQGIGNVSISLEKGRQWRVWQDSRASIVVDVPEACAFNLCELVCRDDVIKNLRSIGLSIKGE